MKAKPKPEHSVEDKQIRAALNTHWHASEVGDANAEHDIYDDDAICDYPQSGERILGRSNLQALRSHHPGKTSGFQVKRILGNGELGITEYTITYQGRPAYTVSIMEFRNGKVVHVTGEHGLQSGGGTKVSFEHSISGIPSRRRLGGGSGFSRSRDAVMINAVMINALSGEVIQLAARFGEIAIGLPATRKLSPYAEVAV